VKVNLKKVGNYVLAIIIILLSWAALAALFDNPAFPFPTAAFTQFFAIFPEMLPHIGISLWRVFISISIGTFFGAALGLFIGRSPRVDALAAPILYILYPIPKVVFLPVLMILFGLGDASRVSLLIMVIFFQTIVTARGAAKSITPEIVTSVRSLGANAWGVARHVVVPAALPALFTALRINTGTAVAVLFFVESIAGRTGIGFFISNSWGRMEYPNMFAGIIAMALMSIIIYEVINVLEKIFVRWAV
jgi:NitT/TauT family transport system permease protein